MLPRTIEVGHEMSGALETSGVNLPDTRLRYGDSWEPGATKIVERRWRLWWRSEPLGTAFSGLARDYVVLAPCPGFCNL